MQISEEQQRAEHAAKQENNERGWQSVLNSKPLAVPPARRFNIPDGARPASASKRRHHRAEGNESAQVIAATEGARNFGEASKMLAKERSHRQTRVKEHKQNQQQVSSYMVHICIFPCAFSCTTPVTSLAFSCTIPLRLHNAVSAA